MDLDILLDDFAIRSFRHQADEDYIAARMAFRAHISTSLWSSQQMIEKYLKCILLLNRIEAKKVKHNLGSALSLIHASPKLKLNLSPRTKDFIDRIDEIGQYRYLEVSHFIDTRDIVDLDRTAWELRRFCTNAPEPRSVNLVQGISAPKVELPGGYLETVINNIKNPARAPLVWQNAFFGKRQRRTLKSFTFNMKTTNAPLYLYPEILDEVLKYVFIPGDLVKAYRSHTRP